MDERKPLIKQSSRERKESKLSRRDSSGSNTDHYHSLRDTKFVRESPRDSVFPQGSPQDPLFPRESPRDSDGSLRDPQYSLKDALDTGYTAKRTRKYPYSTTHKIILIMSITETRASSDWCK